jgi:hypothetical protein
MQSSALPMAMRESRVLANVALVAALPNRDAVLALLEDAPRAAPIKPPPVEAVGLA